MDIGDTVNSVTYEHDSGGEPVLKNYSTVELMADENKENLSQSSLSTVGYEILEEINHHHKEEKQVKSKIGGIQLDYSLIGKEPAKRGCTLKEKYPLNTKGKKGTNKARKNKQTASRRNLDLPVASPTSKILSWNCVASTPVKEPHTLLNNVSSTVNSKPI